MPRTILGKISKCSAMMPSTFYANAVKVCGLRPRELVFDALIVTTKESATHKWLFPTRIRPNSFTWKSSSTAAARIKEAVAEIKTVSRNDPAAAAEGAVRLIERLSPALEHVD